MGILLTISQSAESRRSLLARAEFCGRPGVDIDFSVVCVLRQLPAQGVQKQAGLALYTVWIFGTALTPTARISRDPLHDAMGATVGHTEEES